MGGRLVVAEWWYHGGYGDERRWVDGDEAIKNRYDRDGGRDQSVAKHRRQVMTEVLVNHQGDWHKRFDDQREPPANAFCKTPWWWVCWVTLDGGAPQHAVAWVGWWRCKPSDHRVMSESYSMLARRSVVSELIEVLMRDIAAQVWRQQLPGEHRMASFYGVSRGTMRKALTALEQRGVITSGQGKNRIIRHQVIDFGEVARFERIVFLSPAYDEFPAPDMIGLIHRLHVTAAEMGLPLVFRGRRTFQAKRPKRLLQRLVDEQPNSLWILYHSTSQIQQYLQQRDCSAIVVGQRAAGIHFASLAIDYRAVAHHAVGRMVRAGVERSEMALVMRRFQWYGWDQIVEGFQENGGSPARVYFHGDEPHALQFLLERIMLSANRPRAILTWGAHDTLAAASWLTAHGFSIPGDVAIVGTADAKFLEVFTPALCRYDSPPKRLENALIQLVRNQVLGDPPMGSAKVYTPEAIRGETLPNGVH